eukprot:Phypoly_transcript_00349.p1 GENE.Phypoly_transcript_00349~~Phypoly_transcript_00349.p1  ORF type:complete len:1620 (+),score=193.23 Phypoly_transcript_00349:225-5084(+)
MERNYLMIEAYPFLRKLCMILGLELRVVDMRWGVREERSDNHGTSALCMSEVEMCKKKSLSCAFVTFLGNKYGYRPFPAVIGVNEFEILKAQLKGHPDLALLDEWFDLDTNNLPPQYVLRPILEVLPQYRNKGSEESTKWWPIFEKLQTMLRSAATECFKSHLLKECQAERYIQSVTEEEVKHGIVWNTERSKQTFFFDREYTNIDTNNIAEASKYIDMKGGAVDEEATTLLKNLKTKLHAILPENSKYKFTVDWPSRVTELPDVRLLHFVDEFCRKVAESTLQNFSAYNFAYDLFIREVIHHCRIQKERCETYVNRPELEDRVRDHINDEDTSFPLVLYGESGCGKTCVMAKASKDAKLEHPNAVVIYRFLGTSSESDDVRSLLYSLSCHILRAYGKPVAEVPKDYESLCKLTCLALATEENPLILFLDSLDQVFSEKETDIGWVPINLPPHVHVVLSTYVEIGECFKALKARIPDDSLFVEVPVLGDEHIEKLLIVQLKAMGRTLTKEQQIEVFGHAKNCPLPLYIRLATDICHELRSSQKLPSDFPDKLKGLISRILDKLEHDHGAIVVAHSLSYITCARTGLTLNELEDILSCDDLVIDDVFQWWIPPERRIPPLLWLRIRNDLWRYLVHRGDDGFVTYAWYHKQWPEVIKKRYLECNPEFLKHIHRSLADYFNGKWANGKPYEDKLDNNKIKTANRFIDSQQLYLTGHIPNVRKLSELPYHQLHCGSFREMAENSLGSLPFIAAKIEADKLYELVEDYIFAESQLVVASEAETPGMLEVWDYHRFVRANMHILSKDPSALLQQALNFPDSTVICREAVSAIQVYKPNRMFVRWHNKNPFIDPCIMKIEIPKGPHHKVSQMVASPDGSKVFSMLNDGELRLWNLRTGSLAFALPPRASNRGKDFLQAECYAMFDVDGCHLYYFAPSLPVRVYSSATGHLRRHLDSLSHIISPSVDRVVVVCAVPSPTDKKVAICAHFSDKHKIEFYRTVICDFRHKAKIYTVDPSCSDERVIAMHYLSEEILVKRFKAEITSTNLSTGTSSTKIFGSPLLSSALSLDKKFLAVSTDTSVHLLDSETFYTLWKLDIEDTRCTFHKANVELLVWGKGKLEVLNLLKMEEGLQLATTDFPESDHIYWAMDNRLILTGYYKDRVIGFKIWDYNARALRKVGKSAAFLSINHIVVLTESTEHMRILNTDNYPPSLVVEHPLDSRIWHIYVSPDCTLLACDCDSVESGFKIYKIPEFKVVLERQGNFLCFSPDNKTICYEKQVKNKITKNENVIVMEKISKSAEVPAQVLRLSGDTLKENFSSVQSACYSNNQKHLLYSTSAGAAMYHFETKTTTILKFPWASYNANGDYYDYEYTSSNTATFSPDDSHFVVSLTTNNEEFTVIYTMLDFTIKRILPGISKAISFMPNQPNVFTRLTNSATEWWNLQGKMLHRFYTLNVPACLSIYPDNDRSFRAVITDEHGYAYLLSPHNPTICQPDEQHVHGVQHSEIRLRERPSAVDAARFFWEMRDYPADYLFYWKYLFPGDRGQVFPVFFSDTEPYELIEDMPDKYMHHMRALVGEMEAEIRAVNHTSLASSFSGFSEAHPSIHDDVARIFTKFTDRVNKLVARDV